MADWLQVETTAGVPFHSRNLRVTPFARAYRIQFPGVTAEAVWARPVSVLVQDDRTGEETVIPIIDVTRLVQWYLLGTSLLTLLLVFATSRKKKKQKEN